MIPVPISVPVEMIPATESKSTSINAAQDERILSMLGKGIEAAQVAAALGIDKSRISQLVSNPEFAARLQDMRYQNLQQHNERDSTYDSIEDKLLEKLNAALPFLQKPLEINRVLKDINTAKRRGIAAADNVPTVQTVVQLTIPVQLAMKFTTNIHNQVVSAGSQDLVTIGTKSLDGLAAQMKRAEEVEIKQLESRKENAYVPQPVSRVPVPITEDDI